MEATPAGLVPTGHLNVIRRPLATARPGLDHLRAALKAQWEAEGASAIAPLAAAFLQAAIGTPEADSDLAAVARWAVRLNLRSPHRNAAYC
ncbi:MAG TPA: hypothetical protein VIR58_10540 [Acidimicrobiales bacterium]